MYHGTDYAGFSVFNTSDVAGRNTGAFFSSEDRASFYTHDDESKLVRFPREFQSWDDVEQYARENRIKFEKDPEYDGWFILSDESTEEAVDNLEDARKAIQKIKAANGNAGNMYACFLNIKNPKIIDAEGEGAGDIDQTRDSEEQDGVIVYNVVDGTYDGGNFEDTNFIVFNPEQIKSATDNRGTFDVNNRDIYYQTQPSGTRQGQAKFYEEFNNTHERPEYLNTGNVTANINDYGNGVEIEFLGQRANGISRSAQFPSGRKASQQEREGVIKYLLYDAIPELELRIHDMFGGFPTVELQQKYNGGMPDGGNIKNLTDEQKNEIFSAAESLIQQIMGSPLSKDGRELISKAYGEISFNDKSNKTSTEQENNEQEVLKAAEPKFNLSDEQIEELFEDGKENTDNLEYGENGEAEYETPIEEWDNLDTEEEIINARTSWPKNTSSAETQSLVEFFSTANKSSGFHELAHHILRVLTDAYLEGAEDYVLINDVENILRNAKVSKEDFINNKGTAREEAHEYFAKAFETYLYEGHAPTQELANTFERIKQWLVEVYQNIKESLGIELNEEMRDIFDRLLATPEQLAEQKSISDIDTLYEATEDELELSQESINIMEAELADIQAQQEFLEEMQRYDIKAIPDNILESVREWIEDKENEGLTEEAYSTDLHSKQKLVRERARQALLNTEIGVPLIEVNADTVNALIAEGGVEIAKKYLTERQQYLNKLVSELQKLMPGKFAKTASQNSLIEKLTNKRKKLYNDLKKAKEQQNTYLQRQINLTLETIKEKLKELREGKKNPQAEYDTAKKDIDAGIKEQADIREWLNALDKIDPEATANEAEEANSKSRDTLLTLGEAMIKGYEMAEKYSLEGFTEGQNYQSRLDNEQQIKELEKLNTEHREEIKSLNKEHKQEISNLKAENERQRERQEADNFLRDLKHISDLEVVKARSEERLSKEKEKNSALKEKIKNLKNEHKVDLIWAEMKHKERINALKNKIVQIKENQKKMRERQRERQNIKKKVAKLVKNINRMAKAQNVDWFRQQDIKNLLDPYDTAKLRSLNLQDIEYLHDQVKEIYETGKRELAQKRLVQQEYIEQARRELAEPLRKDWENRPKGVTTSPEETGKQYKGVKGRVQKILDWTTAKTFGAQRFFDYLDGYKHNKGAFSKYFLDDVNAAYNTKLIHEYARLGAMEKAIARLGIRAKDLAKTREFSVPHRNGKNWTVEELIGIYAGLKNPKSRDAILFGNFSSAESYEQAEAWANEAVSKLGENEKALGDFIIQEYEENFERINNALVKVWNRGMNHEENYTPIRRLEVTSSKGGMINPDAAAEALINPNSGGSFGRVERGFSQSRVNFGENAQPGMNLKIFSVWYSQVEAQEHAAAFGEVVQNLRRILLGKGKNSEASIYKMIKETHGKYAAEMIKQYFNIAATNETMQAYNSLDDIAKFLAKNMSIAYLCCNMGTALKQINSLAFVIPYASPTDVINNFIKATTDWENFSKECFQLDPQLKARNGDPIIRELRKGEGVVYDNLLKWASTPIGFMDRFTSCVVFKSVYDSNLRQGLSQNDAIKEAQRVVLLTQPPAHVKDKPLIWQQHGYARLAMMFTNSLSNIYGITMYDLTQAIRNGEVPRAFTTAIGLTLAAMYITALTSGGPDEPDDPEEWAKWTASAFTEQTINSIPLIGKEALALWDYRRGYFKNDSAFIAPFAKLAAGTRGLWDDKNDNDERAIWNLIEGSSLLAPFPSTALHRLYNVGEKLGEGEIGAALKRMVGINKEEKRIKKAVSY